MIRQAYQRGITDALAKFALAPPSQVDQFVADVEQGKDAPPPAPMDPMASMGPPPALDGTTPLQMPSATPTAAPPQGV